MIISGSRTSLNIQREIRLPNIIMKNWNLIILSLVLAAVVSVEIIFLTEISLWHDEAFSALLLRYDFSEMISRIQMDVHPPLYYIILRLWTGLFTDSLFSLRMFSVFFGALAIAGFYALISKAFKNRSLSLFSSLLFALSYFQIQYAMEARMYSLGLFLVIISTHLLLRAMEEKKLKWWLLYAAAVSAGIYTHYFVAFWVMAQAIYLVIFFRKEFRSALLAYFLVLASYVPWLPTFLRQFRQVQETYWIPPIGVWSIPNTISKMTLGAELNPDKSWLALILLTIAAIVATIFFLKRMPAKEKWLFFISLVFPFLITAMLSYKRSIYIDRYFIFGFPFYILIAAGAILAINKKMARWILVSAALAGVLITFPYQWSRLGAETKPGMSAAAKYINENAKPDEKIFVSSSLVYFNFKYYNKSGIQAKLYAPDPLPHFSGTALLDEEDIIDDFGENVKKNDLVWLIDTTGFGNYRPALPLNWKKLEEKNFQDVYDYRGWVIVSKYIVNE